MSDPPGQLMLTLRALQEFKEPDWSSRTGDRQDVV